MGQIQLWDMAFLCLEVRAVQRRLELAEYYGDEVKGAALTAQLMPLLIELDTAIAALPDPRQESTYLGVTL